VRPQVILMDIDLLPGKMNGIEAVQIIRARYPDMHVVMQTVFDDDEKILAAILAGANGYIVKSSPNDRVVDVIRAVLAGERPMSSGIAAKIYDLLRRPNEVGPRYLKGYRVRDGIKLSTVQHNILNLLIQGMPYKLIGDRLDISIDLLRYHVKEIYKKLRADNES
jgi:DNA-binding NarL/FixJ family response regulator